MKKKYTILTIVLIILNLILMFYLINRKPIEQLTVKQYEAQMENTVPPEDIYADLDIVVYNLYEFVKIYPGELPTSTLTEALSHALETEFLKLQEATKGKNLQNYFANEKQTLNENLGITEYSDFANLVQVLQVYKTKNLEIKRIEIEENSCKAEEEYTKCNIKIEYTNQEILELTVKVNNKNNTSPRVILLAKEGGQSNEN